MSLWGAGAGPSYQNGRFFPQKVLSESEIDENFKQLFKQLAGPVRGRWER